MTAINEFLHELSRRVAGDVRADSYTRTLYSTDASLYQVMPLAVLIPKTTDDMQAAIELAYQYNVPILPRAGGSSLAGQAVNEALVIDTSRHLDQLLELNVEEQWVRVQPGIIFDVLDAQLKPHGLQFGPDPASSNRAAMGGVVANNSSGSHSIVYGMAVDHVLELKTILDDGSMIHMRGLNEEELQQHQRKSGREGAIYRSLAAMLSDEGNREIIRKGTPRHWRRCGGYNLARFIHDGTIDHYLPQDPRFNLVNLLSGSEGTLGAISEIKLKLVPRPKKTALVIVEFDSLQASLEVVPTILETSPTAIELIDHLSLSMAEEQPIYAKLVRSFLQGKPFCFLAVEYCGESESELKAQTDNLIAHLQRRRAKTGAVTALLNPAQQANVWKVRKAGLDLLMSVRSDYKPIPFIEDTAVPPQHLAEYIPRIQRFCDELGTQMTYYAHASSGCLHIRPLINVKLAPEIEKMRELSEFVSDLLGEYGGVLSSEHGDGRVRSWLNERFYGPELYGLFKQVKQIFDPKNLFNPGNIVDAPPQDTHLRYGPSYKTIELTTKLHFSEGFAQAVEMCNGAGICRKITTGAMCPSFMATREEEHSTRGRANLLRAAISGRLPVEELTGEGLYHALELCVSCKACKSECPSSVDMAKLKTEFLAHYYDEKPRPLRDYLFGYIDELSRLSSGPLAPVANAVTGSYLSKRLMERTLKISSERSLPHFAKTSFPRWLKRRPRPSKAVREVVLFSDTLSSYSYPEVAIAATEVLEATGCAVQVAPVSDSGRPAFSKGMVDLARRKAKQALSKLDPLAQAGLPIIFLEPSDWSMLIDDYQALLPDDERVARVAANCFTFEQYIAKLADQGELQLNFRQDEREVLLHGHCHQKALGGTAATVKILSLPPNYRVREVDSSCCGMAGSFGYESEHFEVSRRMASRRLLGAVREASPDTIVVAPGVSCRQQIGHGSQRKAIHPAQALRKALQD